MSAQLDIHYGEADCRPEPIRPGSSAATLLRAAAGGDPDAWAAIVRRYAGAIRAVTRGFRLCPADADDVMQTTWLRLLRSLDRIEDPDALAGWLATTARRESLRAVQGTAREFPTDQPLLLDVPAAESVDDRLAAEERCRALRDAISALPARPRALLGFLLADCDCSYDQVSEALAMPIGSIGPTRERSLARLRADEDLIAVLR